MQQREKFLSRGTQISCYKNVSSLDTLCLNPKQKNIALVVILFHLGLLVYLPIDRVIGGEIQGTVSRRLSQINPHIFILNSHKLTRPSSINR